MIAAPFLCGEMHYPRIPRAYWRARLEMAYAMGLDAISTYVFWNLHEPRPGLYDFDESNDVAEYIRLAADVGLSVLLRPGPYVCAEWDFGGLPSWLLADPQMRVRTAGEAYMAPVRRWLQRLGRELAPLQRSRGGPIVAVQLENEYGAFGNDRGYLQALRSAYDAAGFGESPYYTIDQPADLANGSLPDLAVAATFAPGDPQRDLKALEALRPGAPPACGEYWAGWFDHWGEPHERRDDAQQLRDLEWMLANGVSVNLYMFHGGTNFGFSSGANATPERSFQPVTTSYDYLAALDEAGRPTPKYHAIRELVARSRNAAPRPLPPVPQTMAIAPFELNERAALADVLGTPIESDRPVPMESFGQSFGFALYRTTLPAAGSGVLEIDGLRDYAVVLLDGRSVAHLDRRLGVFSARVETKHPGARLDVLVENGGRINYGPQFANDRKGITRGVRWAGEELVRWQIFPLPLDELIGLRFGDAAIAGPAFHRGTFEIAEPADTFLDVRGLGKGCLWVNGRHAGRYWSIGPQRSLYVPGSWLRHGANVVIAFELIESSPGRLQGGREPVLI